MGWRNEQCGETYIDHQTHESAGHRMTVLEPHGASALSYTVIMARRRSKKAAERETRIQKALAALSRKEFPNVNQAALHFGLNHGTLNRRYNGGKSIAESRKSQQLFTISEEHAIA